jgi:hypothetical protein
MKPLKPLANFAHVGKRIAAVAAKPPAAPLKGRGYVRTELTNHLVFARLQKLAPAHCETVAHREPINRFGKLGFAGHCYVSPELSQVIEANAGDFRRLELALQTVADSRLF